MAQTYTRQSTFADGDTITAALFNDEYNQLVNAFAYSSTDATSTGHRHDGTAGQGGNIPKIGDLDFLNKIEVDSTNNRWGFYVEVSSAAVEQIRIQDGAIVPVTDNDIDLGTSSLEFKDLYLDGTATIDTLTVDGAATVGTTLGVTGATTLSSTLGVTGATTLSSTLGVTGATTLSSTLAVTGTSTLTGNVTTTNDLSVGGNLTVTGNATISGNLTFGDADTDSITLTADVASHITPDTDNTYDLGSSTKEWRDLYIDGTAYVDAINFNGTAITATAAELNIMDGVTATATEINLLDGVTSTTAELNILDGVTSTTAELNILDGVTATAAELNVLDGVTAFVDEDDMSSNSATSIPSQQSVKAYVDSQVTAQDLDFQGDSGGALSIDLDSETLTIAGGTGIDTTGATNTLTVAIDSTVATLTGTQTLTNKTLTSPDVNTPDIDGGTIDSTVIGGSTAAAGTFTTFTSTGIDDNATSTAITIDSSENVNIGAVGTTTLTTLTGPFNGDVVKMDGSSGVSDRHLIFSNSSNSQQWDIDAEGGASSLGVLSFSTNSTERLRIDSAGNVGIGVTDPDNLLTVGGGTQPRILIRANGDAGASQLNFGDASDIDVGRLRYDHSDNSMGFFTSATERMRIDSSGNVGIGVSSPTEKLHISGNALVGGEIESVASGTTTGFKWGQDTATHYWKWAEFNNETASLQENSTSSAASRIAFAPGGNVGIGTSSPESLLHIEGNQTEAKLTLGRSSSNTAGNVLGVLQFKNEDGSSDGPNVVANIQAVVPNGNGSGGYLKFGTHDGTEGGEGSSPVDRMTIDWLGNVGIGTSSPDGKLNVFSASAGSVSADADADELVLENSGNVGLSLLTASTGESGIYFGNPGTNGQKDFYLKYYHESHATTANRRAFTFNTGSAERMRIDSSGNVGIGTTSPATYAKLTVESSGLLSRSTANNVNCQISTLGSAGLIQSSTIAGNSVPTLFYNGGTETMRIDSSGNVGIGTTSNIAGVGLELKKSGSYIGLNTTTVGYSLLRGYDNGTERWAIGQIGFGGADGFAVYTGTANTERMRISSSGTVNIGTTAAGGTSGNVGVGFTQIGRTISNCDADWNYEIFGAQGNRIRFFTSAGGGTQVGSITVTTSTTAYNTSSDQRLKENIVDAPAGNIDDIRVRSFDWKADGSHQTYGMIAQELVDVAPEAVTKGKTEDDIWSVDYSKLVPMMIKEIQDLKAEVAALKGA